MKIIFINTLQQQARYIRESLSEQESSSLSISSNCTEYRTTDGSNKRFYLVKNLKYKDNDRDSYRYILVCLSGEDQITIIEEEIIRHRNLYDYIRNGGIWGKPSIEVKPQQANEYNSINTVDTWYYEHFDDIKDTKYLMRYFLYSLQYYESYTDLRDTKYVDFGVNPDEAKKCLVDAIIRYAKEFIVYNPFQISQITGIPLPLCIEANETTYKTKGKWEI